MSRAFLESYRKPILDSLAILKSTYPGISIWDPLSVLCPGDPCYAFDAGGPLFLDTDHLSGHGNFVLYSYFLAEMKQQGLVD
jgi:hypothetical protein